MRTEGSIQSWRYDRGGDTTLFSFRDFYLFEFFFLYIVFPNGLKPRRVSDFVVNCF